MTVRCIWIAISTSGNEKKRWKSVLLKCWWDRSHIETHVSQTSLAKMRWMHFATHTVGYSMGENVRCWATRLSASVDLPCFSSSVITRPLSQCMHTSYNGCASTSLYRLMRHHEKGNLRRSTSDVWFLVGYPRSLWRVGGDSGPVSCPHILHLNVDSIHLIPARHVSMKFVQLQERPECCDWSLSWRFHHLLSWSGSSYHQLLNHTTAVW